jgi:hypothetical protein
MLMPRISAGAVTQVRVAYSRDLKRRCVQVEQKQSAKCCASRTASACAEPLPRLFVRNALEHPPNDRVDNDDVECDERGKNQEVDTRAPIHQCIADLRDRDAVMARDG